MRRALLLLILGAVAAVAILYGLRRAERTSNEAVASLLPRETVALTHLPDFNGTLEQWHRSDIYQIYREPAVQEFLQKPASHASTRKKGVAATIDEIKEFEAKDAFVALTSAAPDKPKVVAGFRFRCREETANRILENWRSKINQGKREIVRYEQHDITLFSQGAFSIGLVQDRDWVFASNDLDELKAVVDRADGRMKDRSTLLNADESYREGMAEMPSSYALLFYLQPKTLSAKLAAARAALGSSARSDQHLLLDQIRSICATTRFEGGKMHDVIFVGMPKPDQNADLSRSSLALGTNATFLYAASVVNFSKQVALFAPGAGANVFGSRFQQIADALAAAGITPNDWSIAFASEAGLLGDWPQDAHWPSVLVSCEVKDQARARKILSAFTHVVDEDGRWEEIDREGVHYWSMMTTPTLLAIRPVIGLSNRLVVGGLDVNSVETAMRRNEKGGSELANSETYRDAARSLPAPTNFFAYVDLGLLYSRLDATLRPLLLMGAAFMPAVNDYVDLTKFPNAEVITKHLSPIVSSQRYADKGYVAESVGPITINQSGISIGLLAGFGALGKSRHPGAGWGGLGFPAGPSPANSPSLKGGTAPKTQSLPSPYSSPTGTP